jgi:hypothetical protein
MASSNSELIPFKIEVYIFKVNLGVAMESMMIDAGAGDGNIAAA